MKRYWHIYAITWRNSLIREMTFKANFLLWAITELLWFLGQLVFVDVLFLHTEQIGGWGRWEVILLIGTHQMISQVFQAFFYVNLSNLPELVRTGRLDLLLVLPVDAQFAVSTRQFGLDSLVNAGVGGGFVVFAMGRLGLAPGGMQIGCYILAIGLGATVHYALMLILAAGSFWIVRAQGLVYGYYNLVNVSRYPETIFRGAFRVVFTWLVPVILVANLPARMLIRPEESSPFLLARAAVAAVTALTLSRCFWKVALRRYASASS